MAFLRESEHIAWSPEVVAKYRDAAEELESGAQRLHREEVARIRAEKRAQELADAIAAKDARIAELEALLVCPAAPEGFGHRCGRCDSEVGP